jgi:hypothetical protein
MLIRKVCVRIEGNEAAIATHSLTQIQDIGEASGICRCRRCYLSPARRRTSGQIRVEYFLISTRRWIAASIEVGRTRRIVYWIVPCTRENHPSAISGDSGILAVDGIEDRPALGPRDLTYAAPLGKSKDLVVVV